MAIKCITIDDDKVFSKILKHYIAKLDSLELICSYHDAISALKGDNINNVDLVFLDVEMPNLTGIEMLQLYDFPNTKIIMISSKKEYGVDAFDLNVADYLHKPISFSRFIKCIDKVAPKNVEKIGNPMDIGDPYVFVRNEGKWLRLLCSQILSVKANNNSVIIHMEEENIESPIKLMNFKKTLPESIFLQVHRSFIINMTKVNKIDGDVVELGRKTIPISRSYLNELYEKLNIKN
jgi:two-component system LytT family response regulator